MKCGAPACAGAPRSLLATIPAAAATTTTATAVSTAESAAAAFLGTGLVHLDGTALELLTIELLDRLLCFVVGGHLDESEAARLTRVAIGDDRRRLAGARLSEELLQVASSDLEREISD